MNPERMKAGAKVAEKAEKPGATMAPEPSPTPVVADPITDESEGRSEAQPSTLSEGGLDPVITAVLAEIPDRPKQKEAAKPEDLAESEPEAPADSPLKRHALVAGIAGLGLVAVAVLVRGAGGLRPGLTLPSSSTPTPPTAPAAPAVMLPAAPAGLVIGGS